MIDLPLAETTWDQEERDILYAVIDSDRFTMGEKVAQFETAFSEYLGQKYSVMVNSGSSANLLAVAALCVGDNPRLVRGTRSSSWLYLGHQAIHLFNNMGHAVCRYRSAYAQRDLEQLTAALWKIRKLFCCEPAG